MTIVRVQLMPVGALCDMMESISIASKDYRAVLVGMVAGAGVLMGVLWAGQRLKWGVETVWFSLLGLLLTRAAIALYRFNTNVAARQDDPSPPGPAPSPAPAA
eukprot:CAMPEP_0172179560 /NCGR_PEP_ID=MMETSP1050-20130122/16694_1 /TAXON_ID=233186 /ORGANISM="Cryptomonas curvata, Strain CCAP979/52" /LENGTH=102 /DNA_ID=CAMNT_0012852473 /DNA_START=184 /DNA_END=492 /DNA_ORIENTATION=+